MPFFQYTNSEKVNIDYTKYSPVSVIAVFNADNKIKPLYVSLEDLYGNIFKTKINTVKYTKDGKDCTTFCCLISCRNCQQQINLIFYTEKHIWVLEK